LTLNAIRKMRAPMTVAPAVGCRWSWARRRACAPGRWPPLAQLLEADVAHVGQVPALGAQRRGLVEVDRDLELASDALAQRVRGAHALLHRRALERHERHDVGRADARVLALVLRQVDQLLGLGDGAERGLAALARRADEGHDGAVVARVQAVVDQLHAAHGADRRPGSARRQRAAPFAEVGDALDERHGSH
jgi:hypothetical protein